MKINVGVFFGGFSVEHEISVISAMQAIEAMDKSKYEIIPVYISKDGNLYTGELLKNIENYKDMNSLLAKSQKTVMAFDTNGLILQKYPPKKLGGNIVAKIDVAFPVVHGTFCEDGTVQGFFELYRVPYAGPNVLASAVGMDKIIMKKVFRESGIPVLDYIEFYTMDWNMDSEAIIKNIEEKIKYPVIVKPANLGSSVGIKKAKNRNELENAVELAQAFANRIIAERAIVSLKEVNCSVLGDYEKMEASACEEPVSSDEILSYSDKYMGKNAGKGMSAAQRKLPADISKETENEIKSLAIKTFKALCCSGVARIDFLIDMEENKVYVNEINTIPGSLSFYLWEAVGKPYRVLLDDMISLALKRHRENKNLMFSYDTNILSLKGKSGMKSIK